MSERQKIQALQILSGDMLDDMLLSDVAVPQEIVRQLGAMVARARQDGQSIDWRTLRINLETNTVFPGGVDLRIRAMTRGEKK